MRRIYKRTLSLKPVQPPVKPGLNDCCQCESCKKYSGRESRRSKAPRVILCL
jgi:hypothetical protein